MPKPKYKCPRCGYETEKKSFIKRHFFEKKNDCPALLQDLELTLEIKEYVLKNRIYKVPKPEPTPTIQNVTYANRNTIQIVNNMNVQEKLTKYLEHKNLELLDLSTVLDDHYGHQAIQFERGTYDADFHLTFQDLMDIIDHISSINRDDTTFEDLNIVYNPKYKRIMIYDNGEWQESFVDKGLVQVILAIQETYLDMYERFLVRRLFNPDTHFVVRENTRKNLSDYYKFLSCFDLDPFVKDKPNNKILLTPRDPQYFCEPAFHDTSAHSICDELYPLYVKAKESNTRSDILDVKRLVIEMMKRNSSRNLDDLNKKILELLHVEPEFRMKLSAY